MNTSFELCKQKVMNKKLWEFYVAYYMVNIVYIAYDLLTAKIAPSFYNVFETIVLTISTIGLCGFVTQKMIFGQFFWKIFYFLLVAYSLYTFYTTLFPVLEGESLLSYSFYLVLLLFLVGPLMYAMYRYSYKGF